MGVAYDPNRQGWGAAALTVVMTGALLFTAFTIHKNTCRHPRDPMATQVYHERDGAGHEAKAEGAEHKPAGEAAKPSH